MGSRGCWLVVAMVTSVTVMSETVLQCGVNCVCMENKTHEHDFEVKCNASALREATLTEEVLMGKPNLAAISSTRTSVSVMGGPGLTLTITRDFFLQWRQFSICFLEAVSEGGRVVFPAVVPRFYPDIPSQHHYAGMTLTGVSISEVPTGILSGKTAAGLRLNNSTVGRLPKGLLKGTNSLHRLHIRNSTVGVVEGQVGGPALRTETWLEEKLPVVIANSTVGQMNPGAIHLKMKSNQRIVLRGLSLGRVGSGAVKVEGGLVEIEACGASKVEASALVMGKHTRLTLRNNWLALQPNALTQLSCDRNQHNVIGNYFSVLHYGAVIPISFTVHKGDAEERLRKEVVAERKRLVGILNTVIHPSCVSYNLAPLPSPTPTPSPAQPMSYATSSKLAVFGIIGLVVGLVVASLSLLSIRACRRSCRRRRNRHVKPATVVMSQIPDPIYSEPFCTPPEVPPFPSTLSRPRGCSPSDTNNGTCCHPHRGDAKRVENDYMVMKGQ